MHLPGSVQTQVLLGNLAITRRDPDWFRLVLANSIYGGAFHSRLVINIREQKGYTYSPRSGLQSLRQHGYFSVHAAVRNEVAAATLTEMFYEMDRMRSLPVTAGRTGKRAQLPYRRVFARRGDAGWTARPAFHHLSGPLAGGPSGNVSPESSRAHSRRYSRRGAPPLRFRQRANRSGGRPRANRRAGRAFRRSHRIRRAGKPAAINKERNTNEPSDGCTTDDSTGHEIEAGCGGES